MGQLIRDLEDTPRLQSDLEHSEAVREIDLKLQENPYDGDLWMDRGLALAKQALHRQAVESYSKALAIDPFKGIYYRHRGHRFLSCHRFEDACADFTMASRLIPENWDVWYHLGLSWFLLRDYKMALICYRRCLELTDSEDKFIAITDWLWITFKRLEIDEEAHLLLESIHEEMDAGENIAYFNRLLMYKGLRQPEEILGSDGSAVNILTMGFGMANYYATIGEQQKAKELLEEVIRQGDANNLYYAFGYLAAMVDLEHLG